MIKDLIPRKTAAMRVQHARTGTPPVAFHHTTHGYLLCPGPVVRNKPSRSRSIMRNGPDRLCTLTADLPGLVNIEVHLLDQGLDGVETERAAQPGAEIDRRVQAVQVEVVAVDRVR